MEHNNIKELTVVHENCYTATIYKKDIASFSENDRYLAVTLKKNYQCEDSSLPRWESIEPFDKDEITGVSLKFQDGSVKSIAVPFEDVSPNGAYCINKKSSVSESEDTVTVMWLKTN